MELAKKCLALDKIRMKKIAGLELMAQRLADHAIMHVGIDRMIPIQRCYYEKE